MVCDWVPDEPPESMNVNEMLAGPMGERSAYGGDESATDRTLYGLPTYLVGRIRSDVVQRRAHAGRRCVSVKNAKTDDCE